MHHESHEYANALCVLFVDEQIQKSSSVYVLRHSLGRDRQTRQDTLTLLCMFYGEAWLGVSCTLADLSKQLHGHIQAQNVFSRRCMEPIDTLAPTFAHQHQTPMSSY